MITTSLTDILKEVGEDVKLPLYVNGIDPFKSFNKQTIAVIISRTLTRGDKKRMTYRKIKNQLPPDILVVPTYSILCTFWWARIVEAEAEPNLLFKFKPETAVSLRLYRLNHENRSKEKIKTGGDISCFSIRLNNDIEIYNLADEKERFKNALVDAATYLDSSVGVYRTFVAPETVHEFFTIAGLQ